MLEKEEWMWYYSQALERSGCEKEPEKEAKKYLEN